MGDVEFGFEEMQGVKLGYLVIQGKQMFALSQVFTDLLKNIPRTTVHKRMDHLKVQKHRCDLRQLRKLKSLNSVAFHAAKCTLISREDVEALYVSCKAERGGRRKPREREEQTEEETPVWAGWSSAERTLPRIYGAAFGRQAGLCGKAARKDSKAKRRHREARCWSREARQLVLFPGCCAPESCCSSSDSESTSSNNDSDFGSSLSTSSTGTSSSTSTNSGTSDDEEEDDGEEEEEDEECASCSSDDSSDEEDSSSRSDSSSASSHVSSQSIRFRRARLAKTPLLLQPTFRYRESERVRALRQLDADVASWRRAVGSCFSSRTSHAPPHLHFVHQPKSSESIRSAGGFPYSTLGANGTLFPQQRLLGLSPNKLHPALIPNVNCVQDKDQHALFALTSCIKEAKLGSSPHLKVPSPLKTHEIKTEQSDEPVTSGHDSGTTKGPPPLPFKHVKIKVEDTLDDHEYAAQGLADRCKINSVDALSVGDDFAEKEHCIDASKATPPPYPNQEPRSTLNAHCVEEKGEDRNGARVRKSHRVPVWGRKAESMKPSVKVDRSPRCAGKCVGHEGSGEEWTSHSKRRRATSGHPPCLKRPFNFMANFPSPPSLIIGSDGDLSPAYSLKSFRNKQLPHRSHPVWTWQLGACVVPPTLNQRLRKTIP